MRVRVNRSSGRMLAIEKEDGINAENKHSYLNDDIYLPTSLIHAKIERYPKKRIERKSKLRRKKTLPAVVPKSRNFLHFTWGRCS